MSKENEATWVCLLVEDEDSHAELIEKLLTNARPSVRLERARSLAEATEAAERLTRLDCILLDLDLPDSAADATLAMMRDAAPLRPIIILTTEGDELDDATSLLRQGAQEYLPKAALTRNGILRAIHHSVERKKITSRLERQKAQLLRSNEALQHFAHVVAHELKQPLNPILINCELIRRRLPTMPDNVEPCISRVESAVREMSDLVDHMLIFAAVDRSEVKRSLVDLSEIVHAALEDLDEQLADCDPVITVTALPRLPAYEIHLRRAFTNLLSNAIKYRHPDRRLTIDIEAVDRGTSWAILFADNGIGIDPESLPTIFHMFSRGRAGQRVGGHGIGLAYCRRIAEHHGGSLHVESRHGEGSVFALTLPKGRARARPLGPKQVHEDAITEAPPVAPPPLDLDSAPTDPEGTARE